MDDSQVKQDDQVIPSPVPTPSPVGGKKESGVWAESDKVAKEEGDEYWEKYAKEIEMEKEMEEAKEVQTTDQPIKPTSNSPTPISSSPITNSQFTVKSIALSDDQVTQGLKKPTSSGFRWLAEWFIYQLLKAHYFVKKVHGKIMRKESAPRPS